MRGFKRAITALGGVVACAALVACGGGTSGGSDYLFFVTDSGHGTITAYASREPAAGGMLQGQTVQTSEGGQSIALDAGRDELYVLHFDFYTGSSVQVDVFAHASRLAIGDKPARKILIPGFMPAFTSAIALDTGRDELWVGGLNGNVGNSLGRITVLAHASTLDGTVTPTRDITGLPDFGTFALDTVHSTLYLAGGGGTTHGIYVFSHADTLVSDAPVTRTIGVEGTTPWIIAVDAQRDILYVPDVFAGLSIVKGASTATNSVAATISFPVATPCETVGVDSANDRLYVGAYQSGYILDHASTLTSASALPPPALHTDGNNLYSFAIR